MNRFLVLALMTFLLAAAAFGQDATADSAKVPATTAESTAKKARFTPSKDQVAAGQQFLKDRKLYTGEASGKYNVETRAAIRAYQKEQKLDVSGNFNPATLEKMNIPLEMKVMKVVRADTAASKSADAKTSKSAVLATADTASTETSTPAKSVKPTSSMAPAADGSPATPKRPAPFQANPEQIMALQKILIEGKMYSGEATGKRTSDLPDAVKKYQAANSLDATGGINAQTLEKMGIALTDTQKANVAAKAAYDAARAPKN